MPEDFREFEEDPKYILDVVEFDKDRATINDKLYKHVKDAVDAANTKIGNSRYEFIISNSDKTWLIVKFKRVLKNKVSESYLHEGKFADKLREVLKRVNFKHSNKESKSQQTPKPIVPYIRKVVHSRAELDRFYKNWDLCVEWVSGDDELCQIIANRLGSNFKINTPVECYVVSGKDMNKAYDLHGNNSYQNDTSHVIIPVSVLKNSKDIVAAKQVIGARYFNDIVDNNEYREYLAGRHKKSEQIQWLIDNGFKEDQDADHIVRVV